jgi:aminoethylphosphonate catabolism LysR family transcriptional regulator
MDWRSLEAFVCVLREGGVTRAAERLGLTQPAVSARLKALAEQVGRPLLQRRGGRLQPTPAGLELLRRAEPLLALAEDLEAWIRDAGRLKAGRLRLGADGPFGVMPLVAAFRARYPRVTVELRIGNTARVAAELGEGITDAAVLMLDQVPDELVAMVLSEDRLCALVPRGHPLAAIVPLPLARLAAEPLILREPGSATRAAFERALAAAGLAPEPVLELGSREAVREAVAAGLGLSVVFSGEQPPDPRLSLVALEDGGPPLPRVLACLRARRSLRVTSALFALAARQMAPAETVPVVESSGVP